MRVRGSIPRDTLYSWSVSREHSPHYAVHSILRAPPPLSRPAPRSLPSLPFLPGSLACSSKPGSLPSLPPMQPQRFLWFPPLRRDSESRALAPPFARPMSAPPLLSISLSLVPKVSRVPFPVLSLSFRTFCFWRARSEAVPPYPPLVCSVPPRSLSCSPTLPSYHVIGLLRPLPRRCHAHPLPPSITMPKFKHSHKHLTHSPTQPLPCHSTHHRSRTLYRPAPHQYA